MTLQDMCPGEWKAYENLLKMQILGRKPKPTESETGGDNILCFKMPAT